MQRQRHAHTFEHVGTTGAARYWAVAVFDDSRPSGGGQQSRAGRKIKTARAITASAHGINGGRTFGDFRVHGQLAHRDRKTPNFVGRLTFGSQAGEQCTGQSGWHGATGKLMHELVGLAFGQRIAVEKPVEHGAEFVAHDVVNRKKLAINCSPFGVNTLSG